MTANSTNTPRRRRIASMSGVAAAFVVLISALAPATASASSNVPFTDPSASGALTLCGRNDQPVRSGSLLTVPFVWKVISSMATPQGYTRGYTAVFQPIQHEDPSDWSGYQLTTVATFSNPAHPVAQATDKDPPLEWPDHNFPPYWSGFYQLRMFFAGPGLASYNSTYPTAVIRVQGSTWTLVQGGTTPCDAGTAVSYESVVLPKSETDTPESLVVNPHPYEPATTRRPGSSHKSAPSTVRPATSTVPTFPGTSAVPMAVAAGPDGSSHSGHSGGGFPLALVIGLSAVAVALASAGWKVLRRRTASK